MNARMRRLLEHAKKQAKGYARDPERAAELVGQATRKAGTKKSQLDKVWDELAALFRLVRAWAAGRYKQVSARTIVLVIAALIYFVNPMDFIPDVIPVVGLLDDVTVITFVVRSVRKEVESFLAWEEAA